MGPGPVMSGGVMPTLDFSGESFGKEKIEGVTQYDSPFTTKEYTCYHVRLLDEHLEVAIDVLSDMLGGSLLRHSDIEAERAVVLEEIAMSEDDPLDIARNELERAPLIVRTRLEIGGPDWVDVRDHHRLPNDQVRRG